MGAAMKTIGVIGAGQLGLMLAEEAHKLGARVVTLDPAADAPAARVADGHIVAAYDDGAALEELCRRSDVVTYEFENVPGEVLIPLVERYNIPQGFQPLYDSQDRLREKRNAVAHGLRTPRFAPADDRPSLEAAVREAGGFPCVFKTRTLGYDGHGQVVLRSEEDMAKVEPYFGRPGIVEEFVAFDFEASAIVVGDGRETVCFPVGRNVHRDGILDLSVVPAEIPDALRDRIVSESRRLCRSAVIGASLRSSISSRATRSISTKWRRARTTAGTGRSRDARPTSAANWRATCWGCRWKSRGWWLPR